jgi:hypothetical protein
MLPKLFRFLFAAVLPAYFDMGGSSAPDTSGQNEAALQQAALSKEQLAWAKEVYANDAPNRAAATQRANAVSDAQLASMKKQDAMADDYNEYNKGTFRPLEKSIVADATGYDTPERRQQAAADAMDGVGTAFDNQRGQMDRSASSMGVDPNSGNYAGSMGAMRTSEAAAQAAAGNTATRNIESMGVARKMDAASLGRGLPSAQATSAQLATNTGNSAVQNSMVPTQISNSGVAMMGGQYNAAQAGLAGAGRTFSNITDQQLSIQNANNQQSAATGRVLGSLAVAAISDKNQKEDITETSPEASLKAIEDTPVKNWAYKGTSAANDGGKKHTGPMAQDVQKNMGNDAAPGGTVLDLVDMNGHTMNAVKALSKKIDRVAASHGAPMRKRATA